MTRLALVTGASRGIGADIAEALAPGFHVLAVARTVGGLEDLDDRIQARGGQATLAPLDITDAGAISPQHRAVAQVVDVGGAAGADQFPGLVAHPISPSASRARSTSSSEV